MTPAPMVIYHANCNDGLGAALAVWRKYTGNVELCPCNYGDPLPDVTGRVVYIVDFSFPRETMESVFDLADFTTWYDHHKTVFDDWEIPLDQEYRRSCDKFTIVLDSGRSGARIAWEEIFHYVPVGIDYIDDRDRWQFKYVETKAFYHGLKMFMPTDGERSKIETLWTIISDQSVLGDVVEDGEIAMKIMEAQVKRATERDLRPVVLFHTDENGVLSAHRGLGANVVDNISETGNAIAQRSGTFGLTFFVKGSDAICSLRSIGEYDVSRLAKAYNGGGHCNAAGFKMPLIKFIEEIWKQ